MFFENEKRIQSYAMEDRCLVTVIRHHYYSITHRLGEEEPSSIQICPLCSADNVDRKILVPG